MRATRDLAARYGALITMAVMDLSLADIALMAFDRDGCLRGGAGVRRGQPSLRAGHRAGGAPLARRARTPLRATTPGCPQPPRRRSPTIPAIPGSSATCTDGCWSPARSSRATSKRSPATSRR